MRVLMFGAPGVGKGTQASRVARALGIPHISTGDLFREEIAGNTDIGREVSSILSQGNLVPDEITVDILAKRLNTNDCQNGFVLDGFPRTVQQARFLDKILKEIDVRIDVIVNISLDDSSIVQRIAGRRTCSSCGAIYHIEDYPSETEGVCNYCSSALINRSDDSPNVINKRLLIYYDQTKPLIDYYAGKVKIVNIESDKLIADTTRKVFAALEKYETITE